MPWAVRTFLLPLEDAVLQHVVHALMLALAVAHANKLDVHGKILKPLLS